MADLVQGPCFSFLILLHWASFIFFFTVVQTTESSFIGVISDHFVSWGHQGAKFIFSGH